MLREHAIACIAPLAHNVLSIPIAESAEAHRAKAEAKQLRLLRIHDRRLLTRAGRLELTLLDAEIWDLKNALRALV